MVDSEIIVGQPLPNLVSAIAQPQVIINMKPEHLDVTPPLSGSPKVEQSQFQRVPETYANPKITIKTHFVKTKAAPTRCLSGNPKKKKKQGPTIG